MLYVWWKLDLHAVWVLEIVAEAVEQVHNLLVSMEQSWFKVNLEIKLWSFIRYTPVVSHILILPTETLPHNRQPKRISWIFFDLGGGLVSSQDNMPW